MNDLKNRHLFKRAYEIYIEEIQIGKRLELTKKREILEKYEGEIAETTQIPRELIIMYLETNESGMKSYQSSSESYASDEMPFLYIDNNGKIKPMDDKFSLIPKGNLQPKLYVFTNQDNISKANHVCKEIFEK
jgi:hypothetical protein